MRRQLAVVRDLPILRHPIWILGLDTCRRRDRPGLAPRCPARSLADRWLSVVFRRVSGAGRLGPPWPVEATRGRYLLTSTRSNSTRQWDPSPDRRPGRHLDSFRPRRADRPPQSVANRVPVTPSISTTVSVPDELLAALDRLAKRTGRSRLGLVEAALREFVARNEGHGVTEAIDRVISATSPDGLQRFVSRAARRALGATEW